MVICINVVTLQQQQQRYDIFLRIQRFHQRLQRIIHHGLGERTLGQCLQKDRFVILDRMVEVVIQTVANAAAIVMTCGARLNIHVFDLVPDQDGDFLTLNYRSLGKNVQPHTIESVCQKTVAVFKISDMNFQVSAPLFMYKLYLIIA
ncbi:hypothetical protein D3C73_1114620 [compost metagenome]